MTPPKRVPGKRGRKKQFGDAFVVRWTAEQSAWIDAQAEARGIALAEVVRGAVQAEMDGA